MKALQKWLAGGSRLSEDAVLVLAPQDAAEVDGLAALAEALSGGGFRVGTVIAAAGRDEAARLSARFPGALVPVPPALAPARAVLAALRVRAVLAAAPQRLDGRARRLLRAALSRGVPVYALCAGASDVTERFGETGAGGEIDFDDAGGSDVPPGNHAGGTQPAGESCKRIVPPAGADSPADREVGARGEGSRGTRGHPGGGPAVVLERRSAVGLPSPGPLPPAEAAAFLVRATGVRGAPRLSPDRLAALAARAGPGRVSGGFVRRIDSVEALRERLGCPRVLLCLGNGPTSADPAVAAFPHDALFRVNVDWRGGGVLTRPDMVFAGVKRAMRRLRGVPLVVATPRKEAALLACRLFEPWHGPAVYAVAESLAAGIVPPAGGQAGATGAGTPTTGAYMLAVAVALAPERLAVAGMDMFSHPAGAYSPGTDPTAGGSVNAFAASHDFETDAAFIAACLSRHAGELVVFSPALAALLRARCPDAAFTLVDRSGPAA